MFLVDTLCPPYEVDYQVIGPKQALFTSDHALVCQQQLSQRKECTSMYDTCLKVIKNNSPCLLFDIHPHSVNINEKCSVQFKNFSLISTQCG